MLSRIMPTFILSTRLRVNPVSGSVSCSNKNKVQQSNGSLFTGLLIVTLDKLGQDVSEFSVVSVMVAASTLQLGVT